jgi:hypothetical protein
MEIIKEIELILDESRRFNYKNIDFYSDYLYLFLEKDPSVMNIYKQLLDELNKGDCLLISYGVRNTLRKYNPEINRKVLLQLYVKYNYSLKPEEQIKREW